MQRLAAAMLSAALSVLPVAAAAQPPTAPEAAQRMRFYLKSLSSFEVNAAEVATAALVGAAAGAATAGAPPGTIVEALPAGCVAVIRSETAYAQSGTIWYRPRYVGTTIEYVVVAPPS